MSALSVWLSAQKALSPRWGATTASKTEQHDERNDPVSGDLLENTAALPT
jgi:hypothetical protein